MRSCILSWFRSPFLAIPGVRASLSLAFQLLTATTVVLSGSAETRVLVWGTAGIRTGVFPVALSNVVDVAASGGSSVAILEDGSVVGLQPDFGPPLFTLPGMTNVVTAASTGPGVVGLTRDGHGTEYGSTTLPMGGYVGLNQIQDVSHGFVRVVDFAASSILNGATGHGMALRADGTLYGWGQILDATRKVANQAIPPTGVSNFVAVAVGSFHSLGLTSDGLVAAWGANSAGQTNVPPGLGPCRMIAAGQSASAAVGLDGVVHFWGNYPALPPTPLERVTRIVLGPTSALALHDDGTVTGWGTYYDAQGAKQPVSVPAEVSNAVAIAAGVNHFVALLSDDPVRIRQHPTGRTLEEGRSHVFRVRAIGQPPLRYQWRFRGKELAGATNTWFLVSHLTHDAEGDYEVRVSNPQGSVLSEPAHLDVVSTLGDALDAPELPWRTSSDHPWVVTTDETHDGRAAAAAVTTAVPGVGVTFLETDVTGPGVFTFWGRSGMDSIPPGSPTVWVDGLINRSLVPSQGWHLEAVDLGAGPHVVRWQCPLANFPAGTPAGWIDQVAFIPGGRAPIPTQVYPASTLTLAAGTGTNLWGRFDGTPPIQYQWLRDGMELAGATNSLLALANVQDSVAGRYTLNARNDQGQAQIDIDLAVAPTAPVIDLAPGDQLAVPGGSAVFRCQAHGSEPLQFVWLHDGVEMPDAVTSTLVLHGVKASDLGHYRARVSNSLGAAETGDAALGLVASTVIAWGEPQNGAGIVPAGLSNVMAVAAGPSHSLALHSDGTVATWGWNAFDLLSIPPGLSDAAAIAAGGLYSAAIRRDGNVVGWGFSGGAAPVPKGLSNVMAVGLSDVSGVALRSNGTLVAWGNLAASGLSNPDRFTNIAAIAIDSSSGVALRRDGQVQEWGASCGRLPEGLAPLLTDVVAVACGRSLHAALRGDGALFLWDGARWAQAPAGPSRVVNIAAGGSQCLALMEDRTVSAWAVDGTPRPLPDPAPTNVVAIAQGLAHSLAVIHDGTPFIARQPLDRIVGAGNELAMEAVVLGSGPFSYRWYRNGSAMADQTNRFLRIPAIPMSGGGSYSCLVRSPGGTLVTRTAKVTVEQHPPRIDPGRLHVNAGPQGTVLSLHIEGLAGVGPVGVYGSDDLVHWTLVTTHPMVLGVLDLDVTTGPGAPERFIRVVEQ